MLNNTSPLIHILYWHKLVVLYHIILHYMPNRGKKLLYAPKRLLYIISRCSIRTPQKSCSGVSEYLPGTTATPFPSIKHSADSSDVIRCTIGGVPSGHWYQGDSEERQIASA